MIFHLSGWIFHLSSRFSSWHLPFHHISSKLYPSLLHPTCPPFSSLSTPLPSAALPWHAAGMEEHGVGSEWVHVASMTNAGRAGFAALEMKLSKEWQPYGQTSSHLVMRLARLYNVCMRIQRGRKCMIFHKFITWPDLGKFTVQGTVLIWIWSLYQILEEPQHFQGTIFYFPFLFVMWSKEYFM